MAASYPSRATDYPEHAEKRYCGDGAKLLSIEPWNTTADGSAGCEDMPRRSIDIKLTEKEPLIPVPVFQQGRVRAGRARQNSSLVNS